MRIALLSDIHGNEIALNAVLADIAEQGGVDAYWILGDLVALGPEPVRTLEILAALPNTRFIRGNTDRYVSTGDRPSPSMEDAERNPRLLGPLVEVANTFAWTQGMVTASGWLRWLRELPLELKVTLPSGTRFFGVHASPGQDDGLGFAADRDVTELSGLLTDCEADLLCVGHTHRPWETKIEGIHIVNLGAVSLSLTENKDASYVLLNAQRTMYSVEHRTVPYDRGSVINQLKRISHPAREYLIKHLSD
jgi:predicted phosphodiesterase